MRRTTLAAALLAATLACAGPARAGATISVSTRADGAAVEVHARARLSVDRELIWKTLTDYERLSSFIPGLRSSHVLARRGAESVIEQTGGARFWFLSVPIRVKVAAIEHPPSSIDIHLIEGNLRRLDGGYRIDVDGDGTTWLRWEGLIEPSIALPGFVRVSLMRANIVDQFEGMVREIERRGQQRRADAQPAR